MSLSLWSSFAALCVSLVGVGQAAATPTWLELRWPELAGCPTRAEVEAAALRLADGAGLQAVAAEAELRADAAGYTLQLHVRDAGGDQQRTLQSPRCEALAEATAVILAIAAAPLQVAERVVAAREAAPPPRIESAAPVTVNALERPAPASTPPPTRPGPPSRWRPGLAVGFAAAAGLGPGQRFVAGLSGGLSVLWRRVRLELRGSGWLPSRLEIAGQPAPGADLRLAAGAVRGCPRLLRRTLALELCGGLELGALTAEGVGLADNRRSRGLWAAGLLAPGVQWRPLPWLALGLEVEGLVAFTRRRYAVGDAAVGVFHTVPPVGVRLGGGVSVQFF